MNRRWQKEGSGRYDSLPSIKWLLAQLPPLPGGGMGIADAADVYAVFSALHAKGRNPQPASCPHQGLHFLMADAPPAAVASTQQHANTASALTQPDSMQVDRGPADEPVSADSKKTLTAHIYIAILPFYMFIYSPAPLSSYFIPLHCTYPLRLFSTSACSLQSCQSRREPVIPVGSKYQGLTMQRLVSLLHLNSSGGWLYADLLQHSSNTD